MTQSDRKLGRAPGCSRSPVKKTAASQISWAFNRNHGNGPVDGFSRGCLVRVLSRVLAAIRMRHRREAINEETATADMCPKGQREMGYVVSSTGLKI